MALFKEGEKVEQTNLNPSAPGELKKALNELLIQAFKDKGLTAEDEQPKVKDYKSNHPNVDSASLKTAWSEYMVQLTVEFKKSQDESK